MLALPLLNLLYLPSFLCFSLEFLLLCLSNVLLNGGAGFLDPAVLVALGPQEFPFNCIETFVVGHSIILYPLARRTELLTHLHVVSVLSPFFLIDFVLNSGME